MRQSHIAEYLVENHNRARLRAFNNEHEARAYVERLGVRLSRLADAQEDQLRPCMYLALADVYLILPSGRMHIVAHFDGHDRGDGTWWGWE